MKKIALIGITSFIIMACNNAADPTQQQKDSIDSALNAQKEIVDSIADDRKQTIDTIRDRKIDSLNTLDTTTR